MVFSLRCWLKGLCAYRGDSTCTTDSCFLIWTGHQYLWSEVPEGWIQTTWRKQSSWGFKFQAPSVYRTLCVHYEVVVPQCPSSRGVLITRGGRTTQVSGRKTNSTAGYRGCTGLLSEETSFQVLAFSLLCCLQGEQYLISFYSASVSSPGHLFVVANRGRS